MDFGIQWIFCPRIKFCRFCRNIFIDDIDCESIVDNKIESKAVVSYGKYEVQKAFAMYCMQSCSAFTDRLSYERLMKSAFNSSSIDSKKRLHKEFMCCVRNRHSFELYFYYCSPHHIIYINVHKHTVKENANTKTLGVYVLFYNLFQCQSKLCNNFSFSTSSLFLLISLPLSQFFQPKQTFIAIARKRMERTVRQTVVFCAIFASLKQSMLSVVPIAMNLQTHYQSSDTLVFNATLYHYSWK